MIGMDCWTRMTIKQQNFCIWKRPARALEWVGWLLTGRQFAYCVSREPWQALLCTPSRLGSRMLVRIASDHPSQIEEHFKSCPDSDLFDVLLVFFGQFGTRTNHLVATEIAKRI